jgi:LemA protein
MSLEVVLLVILLLLVFYLKQMYNSIIRNKNLVDEGWSGIDVQLKKRYDLVPALVRTVQSYSAHERELFEEVTRLRSEGLKANSLSAHQAVESKLSRGMGRLLLIAEHYPDLKAQENFLNLQKQISEVEDHIQMARRYYNGTVRDFNILIESFPSNLVARMFSFTRREFFEIESIQAHVPEVNL